MRMEQGTSTAGGGFGIDGGCRAGWDQSTLVPQSTELCCVWSTRADHGERTDFCLEL